MKSSVNHDDDDDDANDSNNYDGGERVSQDRINQSIDQQKTF